MLKILVAAQQNGRNAAVLECVKQLSARTQLSTDYMLFGSSTPKRSTGDGGSDEIDWIGRFGSAVRTIQYVPVKQLTQRLLEASAFVDLILLEATHFLNEVYGVLQSGVALASTQTLKAPIYLPSHLHRLPKRVVMPSSIRIARMVTPLRKFLFEGAQIVLCSLVSDSRSSKHIVNYVQAHSVSAGYYAIDQLEGRGIAPMLQENTLIVLSASSPGGQRARLKELVQYTESEYAHLGLSFLILP